MVKVHSHELEGNGVVVEVHSHCNSGNSSSSLSSHLFPPNDPMMGFLTLLEREREKERESMEF